MSLPEFLISLRSAAGFLAPPEVQTDGKGVDPDVIRETLAKSDLWLTPAAVQGFDPNDFIALSPENRSRLARDVERFLAVASQVPPDKPATPEQVREALPPFLDILKLLEGYIADPEGREVFRALWWVRCKFPDLILGFDYELRTDSTGDPAVVIWVVVGDDVDLASPDFQAKLAAIQAEIAAVFARRNINRWPYVRVRTRSESREIIEAGAL